MLLTLCGTASGFYFTRKASMRCSCLQQICQLLAFLSDEIQCRKTDLHSLYDKVAAANIYPTLCFESKGEFRTLAAPVFLNREEKLCFCECFSSLGSQISMQECSRLDHYLQRFSGFYDAAKDEEAQAKKLYPKLGVGAGIMAGLAVL